MTEVELPPVLELPVLPVRGAALFPNTMMPVTVGRAATLAALDAVGESRLIAVFAQRDPAEMSPTVDDIYRVGTVAMILRTVKMPKDHDTTVVLLQGVHRIRILEELQREPFMKVRVERLVDELPAAPDEAEYQALQHSVQDLFQDIVEASPTLDNDLIPVVRNIEDGSHLADFVVWSIPETSPALRQQLLETLDAKERLRHLMEELVRVREEQKVRNKIQADVTEKITEGQRRFFLREQLKAIQRELGEEEGGAREVTELRERIEEVELPPEAREQAERELERLSRIPEASNEYTVARTYLEWIATLPWTKIEGGPVDLAHAAQILDEDHYDLEKIKERILEYLAVYALKQDLRGPILCFVGPPGVGKTSLGKSIAHATGRPFVRISLGGMHDEAEIRGHRRTYVGALPGQIIQGLRRAGSRDPVFMLDEVDKLGRDFRGDPSAALLEVLDPAQNHAFRDNYLDVPFDLSSVLFVCTANLLDPIPAPLLDRMELIQLAGYVDDEKLNIARRYLVPRQVQENGLEVGQHLAFTDEALHAIVRGYTHEAGVRQLEQKIAAVCRKRARQVASGEDGGTLRVTPEVARELLGVPRYRTEVELAERTRTPGVAVALAWTPAGGEVLFIEATRLPGGRGDFLVTGQVREVMQESARTALSWLRANAPHYGIDVKGLRETDVHIHIPAGAIPKDGPSAGVVMAAALFSLFTGMPLRPYVAMTGEITLSGLVLPVGGIREKVLAAKRHGVRELVLPVENEADVVDDIAPHLREGLTFHFVRTIGEALEHAFELHPSDGEQRPRPGKTQRPGQGMA